MSRCTVCPEIIKACPHETCPNRNAAIADEVEDALGDTELLPAGVRDRFDDLLHRLRTGRER